MFARFTQILEFADRAPPWVATQLASFGRGVGDGHARTLLSDFGASSTRSLQVLANATWSKFLPPNRTFSLRTRAGFLLEVWQHDDGSHRVRATRDQDHQGSLFGCGANGFALVLGPSVFAPGLVSVESSDGRLGLRNWGGGATHGALFMPVWVAPRVVALRGGNGKLLRVEGSEGEVRASASSVAEAELFHLENSDLAPASPGPRPEPIPPAPVSTTPVFVDFILPREGNLYQKEFPGDFVDLKWPGIVDSVPGQTLVVGNRSSLDRTNAKSSQLLQAGETLGRTRFAELFGSASRVEIYAQPSTPLGRSLLDVSSIGIGLASR
ncbi:MAG: hypothetical protein KC468_33040 [Myxococcales bacterium]|nr:hypothetical protein [Myxococcales bacterium]